MYLLDTNACLDFLLARGRPVAERVRREFGQLGVSTVTVAELRVGSQESKDPVGDPRLLDRILALVAVHPFDAAAATAYGGVARRIGVRRHGFDRLIGAHAVALGMVLVTGNEPDFAEVPGLVIENWR